MMPYGHPNDYVRIWNGIKWVWGKANESNPKGSGAASEMGDENGSGYSSSTTGDGK